MASAAPLAHRPRSTTVLLLLVGSLRELRAQLSLSSVLMPLASFLGKTRR